MKRGLQYGQAVLIALREVSDALTALAKLTEAEAGQDTAMRALADAVDHATDRYREGLASYYEVLEAQQQLSIPRRSRSRRFAKTAS
jgi:outer membrane protein TolC